MQKFHKLKFISAVFVMLFCTTFSNAQNNFVRSWTITAPTISPTTLPNINPDQSLTLKDIKQVTQYFDGLGRPLQTVSKQGSLYTYNSTNSSTFTPTSGDLVSPVVYDVFGREVNKYLPYVAIASDGSFKSSPLTDQATFYDNANPKNPLNGQSESSFYSLIEYEASPLNRMLRTYAPGNSWVGSAANVDPTLRRNVETHYWTNTPTDVVRIWTVNTNAIAGDFNGYVSTGTYDSGTLYKTATEDEQGNQVIKFKDKEGQIILKKVQLTASADGGTGSGYVGWICTYYIYDNLDQLRAVIQPNAVDLMNTSGSWIVSSDMLEGQVFRYEYDARGRMISKKVPGAEAVWMVYDARDRLVMTQDGGMRKSGKWLYTDYEDYLNRPNATGLITDATVPTTYTQALANFKTHRDAAYNSTSYPNLSNYTEEVLTQNFYDSYGWIASNGNPLSSQRSKSDDGKFYTSSTTTYPYPVALKQINLNHGMLTGTKTKVLGTTSKYLFSTLYYDEKGRVIQTQSQTLDGFTTTITSQYSFSNQVLETYQKQGTSSSSTGTTTKNSYDDLGRLASIKKTVRNFDNAGTETLNSGEKTTARYEYDALGQLEAKKLSGAYSPLATLNYDYNIRGWLFGINRGYIGSSSQTSAFFGMELDYNKGYYSSVSKPFYNGNIAAQIWRSQGDGVQRKYVYTYDKASRLWAADFTQKEGGAWTKTNVDFSMQMGTSLTDPTTAYDMNGNIKAMQQFGLKLGTPATTPIDKLTYSYVRGNGTSNQLDAVTEDASINTTDNKLGDFTDKNRSGSDYDYDDNGNLTKDLNKSIGTSTASGITYNYLNLPDLITVPGKGTINYVYDAGGNKLQKKTIESGATVPYNGTTYSNVTITTTTTYVNGVVYESKDYGTNTTLNTALGYTNLLQFVPHEEGRVRWEKTRTDNCTTWLDRFEWDYFLKDHLGNVRQVLTDQSEAVCYPAATLEDTRQATEKQIYDIVDTRRMTLTQAYIPSAYTQFEGKVYETNGSIAGKKTGLGTVLHVMSGDAVNLSCQSFYNLPASGRTDNNYMLVSDLLGVLVNSTPVMGGKGTLTATQVNGFGNNATALAPFTNSTPAAANTANAYVNWILFDEQLQYVASGADPVNTGGGYKLHTASIPVAKNGFLYVYVSNESNYPVYFDNLTLQHTPGPLLEETHYYPFGLTMTGLSSQAAGGMESKKKFQGQELAHKEFSDGSGLEMYEFKYRMDDPQIGRFWQVDPLADKYVYNSTYAFSENKVTGHVELEGLEAVSFIDANKSEHNKTIVNAANKNQDKSAVHVYAHGNPAIFYNENSKYVKDQQITTGGTLNRLLNKMVPEWKNAKDHAGMTVVLHACRTGRMTNDEKGNEVQPVAQKISASNEFKDVVIVAPTERDVFTSDGEEVGPRVVKSTDQNGDYKDDTPREKEGQVTDQQGQWNVYKNGKLVGSYDGDWTPKGNPGWYDKLLHKN